VRHVRHQDVRLRHVRHQDVNTILLCLHDGINQHGMMIALEIEIIEIIEITMVEHDAANPNAANQDAANQSATKRLIAINTKN